MSDYQKSKFVLQLDDGADEANRRPNLKGEFAVVDGPAATIALWSKVGKETGRRFLSGTVQAKSAVQALTAEAGEQPAPKSIKLKVGQAIAFYADPAKAKADGKPAPAIYGYARTTSGYVKLAGWDRGNGLIAGTAEPYRPSSDEPEIPDGEQLNAG